VSAGRLIALSACRCPVVTWPARHARPNDAYCTYEPRRVIAWHCLLLSRRWPRGRGRRRFLVSRPRFGDESHCSVAVGSVAPALIRSVSVSVPSLCDCCLRNILSAVISHRLLVTQAVTRASCYITVVINNDDK